MSTGDALSTPFPKVDEGTLKKTASAYTKAAKNAGTARTLLSKQVHAKLFTGKDAWTGGAGTTCSGLLGALDQDFANLHQAYADAGSALATYAAAVAAQRKIYNAAATEAQGLEETMDQRGPRPGETDRLSAALDRIGTQAVHAVNTAAQTYARALDESIGLARTVPDRSVGGTPMGQLPLEKKATALIDPNYYLLLFGSEKGGSAADPVPDLKALRTSGRAFQSKVLDELGLEENTTPFTVQAPGKGEITMIPDGKGGVVVEVKDVKSLSATRQILGEKALANLDGGA